MSSHQPPSLQRTIQRNIMPSCTFAFMFGVFDTDTRDVKYIEIMGKLCEWFFRGKQDAGQNKQYR